MRAIALISGGLDSILAANLIKKQGMEVIGLKFKIPFSVRSVNMPVNPGIEIKEADIRADFLDLIKNPRYGFGSQMNPCIDCKIFMFNKARELMPQYEAKFIITGEVLGQRPMSQNRQALELIERKSGLGGLLLRPLSAKLLPETIPEKEGWVKREELLALSGRARRAQIELAVGFGISDYAQPAGGCLLTDPRFAQRLKELAQHKELILDNVELLKFGRHFRLAAKTKLVVSRNEEECRALENLAKESDWIFYPGGDLAGPTALGRGEFSQELIQLAARITCRYCDLNGQAEEEIIYRKIPQKEDNRLKVPPLEEDKLISLRI